MCPSNCSVASQVSPNHTKERAGEGKNKHQHIIQETGFAFIFRDGTFVFHLLTLCAASNSSQHPVPPVKSRIVMQCWVIIDVEHSTSPNDTLSSSHLCSLVYPHGARSVFLNHFKQRNILKQMKISRNTYQNLLRGYI